MCRYRPTARRQKRVFAEGATPHRYAGGLDGAHRETRVGESAANRQIHVPGRPEAAVDVTSRQRYGDGVEPDRPQPQLPLAAPAERADDSSSGTRRPLGMQRYAGRQLWIGRLDGPSLAHATALASRMKRYHGSLVINPGSIRVM
jgi:hypothetical protein